MTQPAQNDDIQMLEAARVLSKQGDFKRAIAFYKEACTRLPNHADAHREMAVLLLHQSIVSWLPWEKKTLAREAALAAGRAESLGDMDGDCMYIVAEVAEILATRPEYIPGILQEAFARYQIQMDRGETVSAFYLMTAVRLAQINEATGHTKAAIAYYGIIAGAAELESSGRMKTGSSTTGQQRRAREFIARLEENLSKGGST